MSNLGLSSIPVMSIRDGYVLVYYEQLYARRWANSAHQRERIIQIKNQAYSGDVTAGARKRMAKAVTLMSQVVKPEWIDNPVSNRRYLHRFSFVTLTVSNDVLLTAREGYDLLLQHFLQWLRRTKGVSLYVWKAEFQERGQLHYHLVFPNFIHYLEIRNKWNALQREAGLLDEYAMEHGHFNPNSTDIHETRDVKNMRAYIMKELGKAAFVGKLKATAIVDSLIKAGEIPASKRASFIDDYTGDLVMDGKVWGCSTCLGAAKYYSVALTDRHIAVLDELCACKQARRRSEDFYSMTFFKRGTSPPILTDDFDRIGIPETLLNDFEKFDFMRHLDAIINPPKPEPIVTPVFVGWKPVPKWEQAECFN